MSEINPFAPKDSDTSNGESNVFLDLNKPDEATGVPAVTQGAVGAQPDGSGMMQGASENSKFNGQVLLAGVVFAIGVGSIYSMRYIGMQAGIKESVTMVEYTASTNTPDFEKRFDKVMGDLKEVSASVRFGTETVLPESPFTMDGVVEEEEFFEMPVASSVDPSVQQARLERQRAERARLEREAKESEYEFMAKSLVLQSIIGGTRPVARISGEPVGIGMLVSKTFKVISIKGSVVVLEVDGIQFELGLGSVAKRIN